MRRMLGAAGAMVAVLGLGGTGSPAWANTFTSPNPPVADGYAKWTDSTNTLSCFNGTAGNPADVNCYLVRPGGAVETVPSPIPSTTFASSYPNISEDKAIQIYMCVTRGRNTTCYQSVHGTS